MGLAASQARFLAITARKMNCEFQSMQIAQEKLSVTRDLEKAAEDYQNSLNATKLVWDSGDNSYDLSFDLMTTPSALNDYQPFLITDTQGKLVLSQKMFNAALSAGVIDSKGNPTGSFSMGGTATNDGSRNAFLYQLGVQGVINSSTIDSIEGLGDFGYTLTGAGGEVADKTLANIMPTNQFISYLTNTEYTQGQSIPEGASVGDKVYGINIASVLFPDITGSGDTDEDKEADKDAQLKKMFCETTSPSNTDKTPENGGSKGQIIITKDGDALDYNEIKELTLGDFLSGKYEMTIVNGESSDFEKYSKALLAGMADLLGVNNSFDIQGLNVDSLTQQALKDALVSTENNLNLSSASVESSGKTIHDSITNAYTAAQGANCIVKGNGCYSVSISNMLKSYLTNFAIAMDGYDSGYSVDADSSKDSLYVTSDPGYYFAIKNDNEGTISAQDMLNADFYNQIYNQICMNGASTDSNKMQRVNDSEYLTHALKNGQLFISALNDDGYFYQTNYNTFNDYIGEVTDDDAIARAEAEYNVKKSKLNSKEESLEVKMKNIDTELSSLTTEYDSVKNLISKNVEKVFTMFST